MPRRSRLAIAGVATHVIQRGNNRGACFFADEDYALYLDHLAELAAKFGCAIHAYVLMTNHVHLLLTPQAANGVSLLMKHLGQRYVQHDIALRYCVDDLPGAIGDSPLGSWVARTAVAGCQFARRRRAAASGRA